MNYEQLAEFTKIDQKEIEKLWPILETTYHTHKTWIKYHRDYYKDWTCLTTIESQEIW